LGPCGPLSALFFCTSFIPCLDPHLPVCQFGLSSPGRCISNRLGIHFRHPPPSFPTMKSLLLDPFDMFSVPQSWSSAFLSLDGPLSPVSAPRFWPRRSDSCVLIPYSDCISVLVSHHRSQALLPLASIVVPHPPPPRVPTTRARGVCG